MIKLNLKLKLVTALFVSCLPALVFAAQQTTTNLPIACKNSDYQFQGNKLILSMHDSAQHVYILNNNSEQSITIDHEKIPPSASAGWASQLDSQHWSVISTNQKNFVLTCSTAQPGNFSKVSCQSVITACWVPRATFPQQLQDSAFWIVENVTAKEVVPEISKRGIIISKQRIAYENVLPVA